ncbi:MAG: gfo/Idh/MocA family oxidoreductase, partial [Clostridia bacterium]|nr:gfo/Idh/MocA family oxidoreductase [Clostridia bacterium]
EDGVYTLRTIDTRPGCECQCITKNPLEGLDTRGHGGGDQRLVEDFVKYVKGEKTTPSLTSLEDSVYGHQAVFLAEKSRESGNTQTFKKI